MTTSSGVKESLFQKTSLQFLRFVEGDPSVSETS